LRIATPVPPRAITLDQPRNALLGEYNEVGAFVGLDALHDRAEVGEGDDEFVPARALEWGRELLDDLFHAKGTEDADLGGTRDAGHRHKHHRAEGRADNPEAHH
jgi:hypothetical protein